MWCTTLKPASALFSLFPKFPIVAISQLEAVADKRDCIRVAEVLHVIFKYSRVLLRRCLALWFSLSLECRKMQWFGKINWENFMGEKKLCKSSFVPTKFDCCLSMACAALLVLKSRLTLTLWLGHRRRATRAAVVLWMIWVKFSNSASNSQKKREKQRVLFSHNLLSLVASELASLVWTNV
jgi:hypothetical protein